MKIDDGTGAGYSAQVDSTNRFGIRGITETELLRVTSLGNSYCIFCDKTSYSTDGTLVYLYNDEETDIIINDIIIENDGAGTHSVLPYIKVRVNPTAGDLITDATAVEVNTNKNYGSSKTLKSTTLVYKGKSGGTLSGGNEGCIFQFGSSGLAKFNVQYQLPRGSSIGVHVFPNLSSGTAGIITGLNIYLKEKL